MKEQDRARFKANIRWFNQFFDGVRTIYEMVENQLPAEFFPAIATRTSDNFYFSRQKVVPSIPPYYALYRQGFKHALQILTIIDENLISNNDFFTREPSIIVILHSRADKSSRLDEFALTVVRNQNIEVIRKDNGVIWGHIKSKYPADFFAFQVSLDKFSDIEKPQEAVRQYMVNPIIENLRKGFPNPNT